MEKRRRRTAKEIRKLRSDLRDIVKRERRITLTDLVRDHGSNIGIRDTVSDKNLVKRQLDILASGNDLRFQREGRDLVASFREKLQPAPAAEQPAPAPPPAADPTPQPAAPSPETAAAPAAPPSDLAAVRAYALQVEAFAKTLQQQLETLAEMLDRATR